jgi:low affinity Fe/Cu permease
MAGMFHKFSIAASELVGSPWTFALALLVVVAWAVTGPLFGYSNTWQLVINTGTSLITFLMVFLIQNTQNRDMRVMQLKVDELLCALEGARTEMVNLDKLSDEDLLRLSKEFEKLGKERSLEPPAAAAAPATTLPPGDGRTLEHGAE